MSIKIKLTKHAKIKIIERNISLALIKKSFQILN